jgi:molybdenum-dependent DNA-binding transcriptional regulator ModE
MTQNQYIINRKLSILDLGNTLGNISEACRKLGVSRQHYYDIKKTIDDENLDALLEKSRRAPRNNMRFFEDSDGQCDGILRQAGCSSL